MNFDLLPPELKSLEGRVEFVKRHENSNGVYYQMSCPRCGVSPEHNESNPSDRFIVWMQSRVTGRPFGMCFRHCHFRWTSNKEDVKWSDAELTEFKQRQREWLETENKRIGQYAHETVEKQGIYKGYKNNMANSNIGKEYWRKKGFNDEWSNYFWFGVNEAFFIHGAMPGDDYYCPSASIPVFGIGGRVEQVKMRVMYPHSDKDRFRNLYKTKAQHLYFPMRDAEIKENVFIAEGEGKAAFVAMHLYKEKMTDNFTVVGAQGKGIGAFSAYLLEKAKKIYLCLDPDAYDEDKNGNSAVKSVIDLFGKDRVRLVKTGKAKLDDAIKEGFKIRNAINMATIA